MKRALLLLFAAVFLSNGSAGAAFYRWVDADGVVHFTDTRNKIPKKYRGKAKEVSILEEPARPAAPAAPSQAAPAPAVVHPAQPADYGGHSETWWRDRFAGVKAMIKGLQEKLAENQTKIVELRRKRTLYHRAQDREAVNASQDVITKTETRLDQALKELDALNQMADRAGVPAEWRQ